MQPKQIFRELPLRPPPGPPSLPHPYDLRRKAAELAQRKAARELAAEQALRYDDIANLAGASCASFSVTGSMRHWCQHDQEL